MSVIDGTRDGAPTFFELPLTSTKYFISVFAAKKSSYTLSFLADIGAWPRPGMNGELKATAEAWMPPLQVQLSWQEATFKPAGITDVRQYWIYSSVLIENDIERDDGEVCARDGGVCNCEGEVRYGDPESGRFSNWVPVSGSINCDNSQSWGDPAPGANRKCFCRPEGVNNDKVKRTNAAVFLNDRKIMNTVCGLKNNTDRPQQDPVPQSRCPDGRCNATIDGVIPGKFYVFNVVVESLRGFNMSYAGLILSADYNVVRRQLPEQVYQLLTVIFSCVLGLVLFLYLMMIKLY
jgi:hypothetical protein